MQGKPLLLRSITNSLDIFFTSSDCRICQNRLSFCAGAYGSLPGCITGHYCPSLCNTESVAPYAILPNFPAKVHVYWQGEKFGLKICSDDVFGLLGVAGCPKKATICRFYDCSVREVAGAAKVRDSFYSHASLPSPAALCGAVLRRIMFSGLIG